MIVKIIISIYTYVTLSRSMHSLGYRKIYHQQFILHNIFIMTTVPQISTLLLGTC